jgi:hypothetical protein
MLLAFAATLIVAPSALAVPTMSLVDPITDNYKASYNADPSEPERRTWLAMTQLVAGGTTWTPSDRSDVGIGDLAVTAADGRTGSLHAQGVSGTFADYLWRVDALDADSGGRWGPRPTMWDPATTRSSPVLFNLTLTVGGSVLARGRVSYRWDSAIAGAPSSSLEYNGPGGRWFVGGSRTRTDQEPAPASPPTLLAAFPPTITGLRVPPIRTSTRAIAVRLFTRSGTARIRFARYSVAGRRFTRWLPIASSYRVVLPRGSAYRSVRFQVRDAIGLTSTVIGRRVRCSC